MLFFLFLVALGTSEDPHFCVSALPQIIGKIISARADWRIGIDFLSSQDGLTFVPLYSRDASGWFNPASTNKLLTASATLSKLRPNYLFSTEISSLPWRMNCTIARLLQFKGDPTVTISTLESILSEQIAAVGQTGVLCLDVDTNSFFGAPLCPDVPVTWELDDLPLDDTSEPLGATGWPVAAQIDLNKDVVIVLPGRSVGDSALISSPSTPFDGMYTRTVSGSDSSLSFRLGLGKEADLFRAFGTIGINSEPVKQGFAIIDPSNYAVATVEKILLELAPPGVSVTVSHFTSPNPDPTATPLHAYVNENLSLFDILNYTLHVSDNTCAELMLRQLGAVLRPSDGGLWKGAFAEGLAAVREFMTKSVGVEGALFRQQDGSGVSRQTYVSPKALTELLQFLSVTKNPNLAGFFKLLPVGGVSGTLKNRFTKYPGMVIAKTGTLRSIGALAGIINGAYFKKIVFAVIVNDAELDSASIRNVIDDIVLTVAFSDPSC